MRDVRQNQKLVKGRKTKGQQLSDPFQYPKIMANEPLKNLVFSI